MSKNQPKIPPSIASLECTTKTLIDKQKAISVKAKVLMKNLELMNESHKEFLKKLDTISIAIPEKEEWVLHFDNAFCVCKNLCEDILNYGRNKAAVDYLDKRLKSHNNYQQKLESIKLKRQQSHSNKRKCAHISDSPTMLKSIIEVSKQLNSQKKACIVDQVVSSTYNLRTPKVIHSYPRNITNISENTISFYLDEKTVFTFPAPLDEKQCGSYSLAEILNHFKKYNFDVPEKLINYMNSLGYIGISARTMRRRIKEYKSTMSLSSVKGDTTLIAPKKGRPANMDLNNVLSLNEKVKKTFH